MRADYGKSLGPAGALERRDKDAQAAAVHELGNRQVHDEALGPILSLPSQGRLKLGAFAASNRASFTCTTRKSPLTS
jgi:hypothetical protein